MVSYIQNGSVKMTKQQYLEMCEALGTEPVESEMPVELEDFPLEVQEVLEIYRLLKDEWEPMNGIYLGKNFTGILEIFDIFSIALVDRKLYLSLLYVIDTIRGDQIKKQQASQQK